MELPSETTTLDAPIRLPQPRQARASSLQVGMEAVLEATVSVPWERPVHRPAWLSSNVWHSRVRYRSAACGTIAPFIMPYGLTTILTDVDFTSLNTLAQQFAEFAARCGPLPARCSAVNSL